MSNEQMSKESAAVFEHVYVPAFVEKLASLGVEIPDEDALSDAIELAAGVKEAMQRSNTSTIKAANLQFKRATGADVAEVNSAVSANIKQAAQRLAADPRAREILLAAAAGNQN